MTYRIAYEWYDNLRDTIKLLGKDIEMPNRYWVWNKDRIMMLASRRADSVLCRDGKAFLMMNKLPKKPLNTPKQPQLVQTQKVCLLHCHNSFWKQKSSIIIRGEHKLWLHFLAQLFLPLFTRYDQFCFEIYLGKLIK